ncbi:MAG: helix-turn-helix domain-containing protein [Planctomycetes bacterium]|nr:helix-turn-helix domain-containing protein [Planctomycetota bacterium]
MTLKELSETLRIAPRTAYRKLSSGELPAPTVTIGQRRRWQRNEIKRWIGAGCPKRDVWEKMKLNQKNY